MFVLSFGGLWVKYDTTIWDLWCISFNCLALRIAASKIMWKWNRALQHQWMKVSLGRSKKKNIIELANSKQMTWCISITTDHYPALWPPPEKIPNQFSNKLHRYLDISKKYNIIKANQWHGAVQSQRVICPNCDFCTEDILLRPPSPLQLTSFPPV